jgi:hypothetical protein
MINVRDQQSSISPNEINDQSMSGDEIGDDQVINIADRRRYKSSIRSLMINGINEITMIKTGNDHTSS